jgi:hypothetical protein
MTKQSDNSHDDLSDPVRGMQAQFLFGLCYLFAHRARDASSRGALTRARQHEP